MITATPAHRPHFAPSNITQRVTPVRLAADMPRNTASEKFVRAMRGAATGVNVVTTDGPAGRFGLTVSAFSSVSAEPPMVLVCINRRSPACAAVHSNGRFCVNVLSATQSGVADTFAGRPATGDAYDFNAGSWRSPAAGLPVLGDATASFECTLESSIDAGTHTIFIGAVNAVRSAGTCPLVYTDGAYHHAGRKA